MLKVKTKYDYRAELCEALRSGKYQQGHGGWTERPTACALVIFYRQLGADPQFVIRHHSDAEPAIERAFYSHAARLLGTTEAAVRMIAQNNDCGVSLANLAIHIENLP